MPAGRQQKRTRREEGEGRDESSGAAHDAEPAASASPLDVPMHVAKRSKRSARTVEPRVCSRQKGIAATSTRAGGTCALYVPAELIHLFRDTVLGCNGRWQVSPHKLPQEPSPERRCCAAQPRQPKRLPRYRR